MQHAPLVSLRHIYSAQTKAAAMSSLYDKLMHHHTRRAAEHRSRQEQYRRNALNPWKSPPPPCVGAPVNKPPLYTLTAHAAEVRTLLGWESVFHQGHTEAHLRRRARADDELEAFATATEFQLWLALEQQIDNGYEKLHQRSVLTARIAHLVKVRQIGRLSAQKRQIECMHQMQGGSKRAKARNGGGPATDELPKTKCVVCGRWIYKRDASCIVASQATLSPRTLQVLQSTIPEKYQGLRENMPVCANGCSIACHSCGKATQLSSAVTRGVCYRCAMRERALRKQLYFLNKP